MAKQTLINNVKFREQREKINSNFTELYDNQNNIISDIVLLEQGQTNESIKNNLELLDGTSRLSSSAINSNSIPIILTLGKYYDINGTLIDSAGTYYSNEISIKKDTVYYIKARLYGTGRFIIIRDANNTITQRIQGITDPGGAPLSEYLFNSGNGTKLYISSISAFGRSVSDIRLDTKISNEDWRYNNFDHKFIKKQLSKAVAGSYFSVNSNLVENSSSFYMEIETKPDTYVIIDSPLTGTGRCILITDVSNNILYLHQGPASGTENTRTFLTPPLATKLKITSMSEDILITSVSKTIITNNLLEYKLPNYLFSIDNNSTNNFGGVGVFEQSQRILKEGIIKKAEDIKINGLDSFPIGSNIKNTDIKQNYIISLIITGEGLASSSRNLTLIKTRSSNALGKTVRYQQIGDSITDGEFPDLDNTGTYGITHLMQKMSSMFNKDHNVSTFKFLSYGTRNYFFNTFTYKSESINISGNNEGRNGWTVASYLRHVAMVRQGFMTSTSGFGFFYDKEAWDLLGLGKKIVWNTGNFAAGYDSFTGVSYETYTGSAAQRTLLRTTPNGKYLPDLTSNLYSSMNDNTCDPTNILTRGQAYNSSLNPTLMNAIVYLTNNPINPYYDFATAQSTGTHGFNYQVYLDRYRTYDDTGNKLLLNAPTIGSKINSGNLTSINVGLPSHIGISLTENDKQCYEAIYTALMGYNEIMIMINLIKLVNVDCKFAIFKTRRLGLLKPREDMNAANFLVSNNTFNYDFNAYCIDNITGSAVETNNISYVPVYATMPPHTAWSRNDYDPFLNRKITVMSNDLTHPSQEGNYDAAYSLLSWIFYTI